MASSNSNETNFLQPIFAAFGLIASILSAVAPLFAQSRLDRFFINQALSLPSSIISVILGILLSWQFISANGFINIPVGIKKMRGNGYNEPWKTITDRNMVGLLIPICIAIFIGFFWLETQQGELLGILQAALYILFFTLLIGAFSLLFITTKRSHEWEQQIANTGSIVFETLERNGAVESGIKILHNTNIDAQQLQKIGIYNEYGMIKSLIVQTVEQQTKTLQVYLSSDYKRLLSALPIDTEEPADRTKEKPKK